MFSDSQDDKAHKLQQNPHGSLSNLENIKTYDQATPNNLVLL